jgi:hypothetical protein
VTIIGEAYTINVLLALFLALASVVNYNCNITYVRHSDKSRGSIYDGNMFIIPATGASLTKKKVLQHWDLESML